jgi:hypothetical protein
VAANHICSLTHLPVCRKEQRDPHWLCFREMTYLGFLQNFVAVFQLWLK